MKKEKLIKKIQDLLDDLETKEIRITDMDIETPIEVGSLSNGIITETVEVIHHNAVVNTTTYQDGNEIDWADVDMIDLPIKTLQEIVDALHYHKIGFDKTMDSIRDEDF